MSIRVLLADDHPILRHGLKSLLEQAGFAVVGEAEDGREALQLARQLYPDIALLDLSMPRLNGLDATRELLQVSSRTKVVLVTVHREEPYVLEALAAGVKGYVLKSEAATTLIQAIRDVHSGGTYLSPRVSRPVVNAYLLKARGNATGEVLSPRELQVLQLLAEGNSTKKIAELLNLTVKTAESYRTSLMEKLDIHDVANLVRYAVRRGLVQP